jgi:hypothetical protein
MRIATNKCAALRITKKIKHDATMGNCYSLGGERLNWCTEVRYLGILVDNKLFFNQHTANIAHKAHVRARLILRCFCSRDCNILMKAFATYVRPLLEYCSQVWSPFTAANINKIEAVQRSFTKHIFGLRSCGYQDRLLNLNLESLETRRVKCDLITMYKLIHGHLGLNSDKFLNIVKGSSTRGHQYKVYKHSCSVNVYKYNFPSRCIDAWNCLPNSVVDAALTTAELSANWRM